ncbi:hypothetical protein TU52_18670 [Bacillus cereus]|nr:hypothetical protein TU52_18670 [Bacillus cereus]
MREIKFRLWDKKYDMLEYDDSPDLLIGMDGKVYQKEERNYAGTSFIEYEVANHFEIMQYTGLKDKNGKEIYEGDVVEHKDYSAGAIIFGGNQPTLKSVIQWKDYYNGYHLAGLGNSFKGEEVEVIGNIYENPELIKTK